MANQVDKVLFSPTPTEGTQELTFPDESATTIAVAWNASVSTLQNAINTALGGSGRCTAATLGANASAGFTLTYIGSLGNTPLTTVTCASNETTGVTVPPQPSESTAGVVPESEVQAIALPGSPTQGNYQIQGDGSHSIPWNDNGAALQAALDANLGSGVATASGSAPSQAVTWVAAGPQSLLVATSIDLAVPAIGIATANNSTPAVSYYLSDSPTTGSYILSMTYPSAGGAYNTPIAWNAAAGAIQTVLSGWFGAGLISVCGSGTSSDPFIISSIDGVTAVTLSPDGYTLAAGTGDPIVTHFTDGVLGVNEVHTLYTQSATDPATGGTFDIGAAGGSAVIGAEYNDSSIAADWSTATGQTFTATGSGTQGDPWVLTGPQMAVAVPSADYSGLTQPVTATTSTVTPGSPAVALETASMILGLGVWV